VAGGTRSDAAISWTRYAPAIRGTPASATATDPRIALGAWIPGVPRDAQALTRYTERSGGTPAILHWFQRWESHGAIDPRGIELAKSIGAAPMISWEPWQGLDAVADGSWDAAAEAFARSVASFEGPILLRFAHEMNLPEIPWFGPPTIFAAAWQRVRRIFRDAGADHARWVWSPYAIGRGVADLRPYFPGREQVDWVALDGYNWGRRRWWHRWASFERIFGRSLRQLEALAPGVPQMLAEIGCSEVGGDKAAWMRDALLRAIPERHPLIRAVVWFDEHRPGHPVWRVNSSAGSLAAWREAVADARYGASGADVLAIGPVSKSG
jgi:hypothetical protein